MLRHLLIAGTALIFATTGALAATPATWQGGVIITSLTNPACANGTTLKVGQTQLGVFRPKLNVGEPNSAIALDFNHGALLVTVNSTAIPPPNSGTYTGVGVDPMAMGGQYTGGTYVFTITPKSSTITASTPQVTIVGSITQFGNISGCTAGFKGSFFLEP